ncbi:MAG: hypothetical protein ACRDRW_07550 [Pseudonocardiaceae bacterium]
MILLRRQVWISASAVASRWSAYDARHRCGEAILEAIADLRTVTLTLLVPAINLGEETDRWSTATFRW